MVYGVFPTTVKVDSALAPPPEFSPGTEERYPPAPPPPPKLLNGFESSAKPPPPPPVFAVPAEARVPGAPP